MKKKFAIGILLILVLTGCKGYLAISGTVTDENDKPLKAVNVSVVIDKKLLVAAQTDTAGYFSVGRKAPVTQQDCKIVFGKHGYRNDTIDMKKDKGKAVLKCDHKMEKKK